MILFADTETYSSTPIRDGVNAYSDADDAELMIISYARDDDPVTVLDLTAGDRVGDFYDAVRDAEFIVFHNSGFDRTILRKLGQLDIPPEKIHDTLVNALAHGLPGGLDKLCGIFNVKSDQAKDKRGKELIQMFCKPQPKNQKLRRKTRDTHPVEWQQFLDYAGSDILAMRAIYRAMPRWSFFDCPQEHALWCLDQRVNDRGFGVDRELAEAALRASDDEKARLKDRTQELTDGEVESTTKRDQLLAHVLKLYGVDLSNLQGGTLERWIEDPDLPEPLRELLRIRLSASQASVSKFKKMLQVISPDSRMRGGLQFSGAARTARWSGRLFQPQNLPRPNMEADDIELLIDAVKAGCEDLVETRDSRGNPIPVMKALSNAVRGLIVPTPGRKLIAADLSNIEGRVLAWLANEDWKLQAFRDFDTILGYDAKGKEIRKGPDLYSVTYSKSFNVPLDQVTKDQRQLGKVAELACGYQGAVGAFGTMAKLYGIDLPEKEVLHVVGAWRDANENIRSLWKDLEAAAREAILNPGVTIHCRKVSFTRYKAWLKIRLPSGRFLSYASPSVDAEGKISYWGLNSYTRRWEKIYTYGGKIAENIAQAVARDVMAANMPGIELAGYEIVLTVHDEIITEAPDTDEFSAEALSKMLATHPDWEGVADLPLAAAGFEGYRYRKD